MKQLTAYSSTNIPSSLKGLTLYAIRPFRIRTIAFFSLSFLGILSWVAGPYIINLIINELTRDATVTSTVTNLVIVFAALKLTDELFWRSAEALARTFKPIVQERVRYFLFKETLARHDGYFSSLSSGRIAHWINQTVSNFDNVIRTIIWDTWGSIISLLLSAIFLFSSHWSLVVLFIAWLILLFWFNNYRGKGFSKRIEVYNDEQSIASGMVVDSISNSRTVKTSNAVADEAKRLEGQIDTIIARDKFAWTYGLITNAVKGNSAFVANTIAVILVINLYVNGQIELGSIVLFIAYFDRASAVLWDLAWSLDNLYRLSGTINNALKGLDAPAERAQVDTHKRAHKRPTYVELQLEDVEFAYPDQPEIAVLKAVNTSIEAGQKVGVVGHSGAGKSTLFGVLLGFYDATEGTVRINDEDVTSKDPSFVRSITAYVPQDTSLFNRTVRENVAYGSPMATDKDIKRALKLAEASEFVQKLPDGLDTLIGERGVKLSGGQRQRLAIARAILKDTPLLLLDEATSALDSVSEQAIQKALQTLMKDRTTIVIAHRLSTLKHLDRILVFDEGTIVEDGSHDQLLRKKGIYADLWARQKDGFIG